MSSRLDVRYKGQSVIQVAGCESGRSTIIPVGVRVQCCRCISGRLVVWSFAPVVGQSVAGAGANNNHNNGASAE